ncbi:MAG TPA: hypothetical protein VGO70_05165 [Arsenicitalea sp.]|nr:hypothetical protein [Arsenicitalea sp.]
MDQLRHAIDSGETGEKVAFPDPAAAPLGTDAEAGGHPPAPREVSMDLAASRTSEPRREGDRGLLIYLGLVSTVMLAALVLVAVA